MAKFPYIGFGFPYRNIFDSTTGDSVDTRTYTGSPAFIYALRVWI